MTQWIHVLCFPILRQVSLLLWHIEVCKALRLASELPTFCAHSSWYLWILHHQDLWSKYHTIFWHCGALVSRLPTFVSFCVSTHQTYHSKSQATYFLLHYIRWCTCTLVTSMCFSGIGNDASLGTYSLTLGSTWRSMKLPEMDQKSFLASPSYNDESWSGVEQDLSYSPWRLPCSSPQSGRSWIKVNVLKTWSPSESLNWNMNFPFLGASFPDSPREK